jgi:hypothetical protein
MHRRVFYLKHSIRGTGSCLRRQVEPIQFDPLGRSSLLQLKTDTEFSPETLCFK